MSHSRRFIKAYFISEPHFRIVNEKSIKLFIGKKEFVNGIGKLERK